MDIEEVTETVRLLNSELVAKKARIEALEMTVRGLLRAAGRAPDAMDDNINAAAATMHQLRLEEVEKISPGSSAAIDRRTQEEINMINLDVLERMKDD